MKNNPVTRSLFQTIRKGSSGPRGISLTQILFIHGVATRRSAAYDLESKNRNRLFREVLLEEPGAGIHDPIWGNEVPEIPVAIFDRHTDVATYNLGVDDNSLGGLGDAEDDDGTQVAQLAQRNGTVALDAIMTTLVEQREATGQELNNDDIAAFKQAVDLAEQDKPLPNAASDDELAANLMGPGDQSLSVDFGGAIRDAVTAVADRLRNAASGVVFDASRGFIGPAVGKFFGDVFTYLNNGAVRENIRTIVRGGLEKAWSEAKAKDEPLICIGHSLGGVILYDMLSSPASAGLPADLQVDAFITVGSQPGLFQSLNLFELKHKPGEPNPGPDCVKAWMNIFDPIDPFGYYAEPMFSKVKDYTFDSVTGLVSSHTTYFKRPQFHARSRARLKELGVI